MTDGYEAIYQRVVKPAGDESGGPTSVRTSSSEIRHLTPVEIPA